MLYIGGTANTATPMSLVQGALAGPASFGTGLATTNADVVSGGLVGILGSTSGLFVPAGYVSQSPMASSATWNGASFASLELTPGTYTWTWGTGSAADTFTVQIGMPPPAAAAPAAVPTLSLAGLAALSALIGLLGFGRMRRKA
jgi:hypothetical protein